MGIFSNFIRGQFIDVIEWKDQASWGGKVAWVLTAGIGLWDVGLDGTPFVAEILPLEFGVDVVFWLIILVHVNGPWNRRSRDEGRRDLWNAALTSGLAAFDWLCNIAGSKEHRGKHGNKNSLFFHRYLVF